MFTESLTVCFEEVWEEGFMLEDDGHCLEGQGGGETEESGKMLELLREKGEGEGGTQRQTLLCGGWDLTGILMSRTEDHWHRSPIIRLSHFCIGYL
jgi:hypothetical protein